MMKDMETVASYIATRYREEKNAEIDEMKLHKLMYLAQRESLARTNEPLYQAEIQGWRLGPVLPGVRNCYKEIIQKTVDGEVLGADRAVVDAVYDEYADRESLSLSRMTHGEICWRKSRKGVRPNESSQNPIPLEDIRLDAERIMGKYDLRDLDV